MFVSGCCCCWSFAIVITNERISETYLALFSAFNHQQLVIDPYVMDEETFVVAKANCSR